jgi:hypothetical protein
MIEIKLNSVFYTEVPGLVVRRDIRIGESGGHDIQLHPVRAAD